MLRQTLSSRRYLGAVFWHLMYRYVRDLSANGSVVQNINPPMNLCATWGLSPTCTVQFGPVPNLHLDGADGGALDECALDADVGDVYGAGTGILQKPDEGLGCTAADFLKGKGHGGKLRRESP